MYREKYGNTFYTRGIFWQEINVIFKSIRPFMLKSAFGLLQKLQVSSAFYIDHGGLYSRRPVSQNLTQTWDCYSPEKHKSSTKKISWKAQLNIVRATEFFCFSCTVCKVLRPHWLSVIPTCEPSNALLSTNLCEFFSDIPHLSSFIVCFLRG